jgi:hypothetical protein
MANAASSTVAPVYSATSESPNLLKYVMGAFGNR